MSAPRNVPELDAAACLKAQGPGKWSTAVRKHHGPRRWNFVVPVGEGLGCVRRNGTASDWHENVDALGFDFDSCPLERLSLKRMCSKLAGRRLLFVGDSLQVHLFVEFYMMANHSRTGTHGMCNITPAGRSESARITCQAAYLLKSCVMIGSLCPASTLLVM